MADYVRKSDEFFAEVAKRCNYTDPALVKDVYIALMRTILHHLGQDGEIKLPNWGEFRVTEIKERNQFNVNKQERVNFPKCKTIRFSPGYLLREYIKRK